jgi:hypothetical protein
MKVLVDSSVWIDYFRNGANDLLDRLITEDLVVCNDIILTELIPALALQQQKEVIESLQSLELIPLSIEWSLIRKYQALNLKNDINKVGIPDLIIIQQVIETHLMLYSFDKHFGLMKKHLNFELIS